MNASALSDLVTGAFDAAFDEALWGPWLERLTSTLDGAGGTFFVVDAAERRATALISSWGLNGRFFDDYVAGWSQYDPQMAAICRMTGSGIYRDTDHLDMSDRNTADYMAWQRGSAGFDHHISAVALLGDGTRRAGLSIHRSEGQGPVPPAEQRRLAAIFPHVERAMQLAFRHGDMLQAAFWDGMLVGRQDQWAFLLDERGRIVRHTDAAAALLARNDGLDVTGGRFRASRPADDALLQKTVAAAALVTVVDPGGPKHQRTELFREAFGLTAREAAMAAALVEGHSVETAAAKLGIGMPTARTYMRSLFDKTGASGQARLVSLLTKIG